MRPNISPTVSDSVSITRSRSPRRESLKGIRRIFANFANAIAWFTSATELRQRELAAVRANRGEGRRRAWPAAQLWPAWTDTPSDGPRRTPRQLADRPETLPKIPAAAASLPRSSYRDLAVAGRIPQSSRRFACGFPDRGRPAFDRGESGESARWPAPTTCGPPGQPPGPLAAPVPDRRRAETSSKPVHRDHKATAAAREHSLPAATYTCGNPQHVSKQFGRHGFARTRIAILHHPVLVANPADLANLAAAGVKAASGK